MQVSSRDERILAGADKGVELGREAQRQDFGEDLGEQVNEANGPEVAEGVGVGALGQQGEERLVEAAEAAASQRIELTEDVD